MSIESAQTIAITGVNGFVGQHVALELHRHEINVVGISRDAEANPALSGLLIEYYAADLRTQWPDIPKVDAIIHLAGLATVGASFKNPQQYIEGNPAMFDTIAKHYVNQPNAPRVIVVSSGAVYDPNQPMPETESSKLVDISAEDVPPYTISKVLTEQLSDSYKKKGLDCIIARPFNHTGPGQIGDFIIPTLITKLIAEEETDAAIQLNGSITAMRDFTDVRDIARAYRLLATTKREQLLQGVYNVCSGKSISVSELAEQIKNILGKEKVVVKGKLEPTVNTSEIRGDYSALRRDTGWEPTIPIDVTLQDTVKSHMISVNNR